jgi:hypothetical protein
VGSLGCELSWALGWLAVLSSGAFPFRWLTSRSQTSFLCVSLRVADLSFSDLVPFVPALCLPLWS